MAEHARNNIRTATNIDGSAMPPDKRGGKPLFESGNLLKSIKAVQNTTVVDCPYAAEVQRRTGNKFIGQPRAEVLREWLQNYAEGKS
jgi:hypothetical protein